MYPKSTHAVAAATAAAARRQAGAAGRGRRYICCGGPATTFVAHYKETRPPKHVVSLVFPATGAWSSARAGAGSRWSAPLAYGSRASSSGASSSASSSFNSSSGGGFESCSAAPGAEGSDGSLSFGAKLWNDEEKVLAQGSPLVDGERHELAKHLAELQRNASAAAKERQQLISMIHKMQQDMSTLIDGLRKENMALRAVVRKPDARHWGSEAKVPYRPTLEVAALQPSATSELGNEALANLALSGNHAAQRERLLREIMTTDMVSWEEAHKVLDEMDKHNERFYWAESAPYRIGFTFAFVAGVASVFLVFHRGSAKICATQVAGEELPKDVDEQTVLQVGAWTWSWMEPLIGTASFVLLCCQFSRAQLRKMNMKGYTEHILQYRADRLSQKFPRYDKTIVSGWAQNLPPCNLSFFPVYERDQGILGSRM